MEVISSNASLSFLPADTLQKCQDFFGVHPKPEQLHVVANVSRGQDCILIAGCGWGKTLVYFLPLVLWPNDIVVVITPLKALGDEQDRKLEAAKIRSINLKRGVEIPVRDLANGVYRAVFLSPEIIFTNKRLRKLWHLPGWRKRLRAIVVDEAHCVGTWGTKFRTAYSRLGGLRSLVPSTTAFVAVSATLPPLLLATLIDKLSFMNPEIVNVGNDRINIKYRAVHMQHPASSFKDLAFLKDMVKTIVYFQSINKAEHAGAFVRKLVDDKHGDKVGVYHAMKSEGSKAEIMEKFRSDRVRILLSTEAAGMGCDISDVIRVVQYEYPDHFASLIQRLGRAARSPDLSGFGILLVPQSPPPKVELILQQYVVNKDCRRSFLNTFFGNKHCLVANCCDICHPDSHQQSEMDVVQCEDKDSNISKKQISPQRTPAEKERARELIEAWRLRTFQRDYKPTAMFFTKECVMTGNTIKKLADKCARITTPESILDVVSWRPHNPEFVQELGKILVDFNAGISAEREQTQQRERYSTFRMDRNTPMPQVQQALIDLTNITTQPPSLTTVVDIGEEQPALQQRDPQPQQNQQQQPKRQKDLQHQQHPRPKRASRRDFKVITAKDFIKG